MSVQTARPLSPHLQIYKKQLTSATSIIHRLTGIALALGLPVLSVWLMAASQGAEAYEDALSILRTTVGQIALLGWTWALFYHFCNGIRHLIWDTGRMLTIKEAYRAGYVVIAASLILTALVWLSAYGIIL